MRPLLSGTMWCTPLSPEILANSETSSLVKVRANVAFWPTSILIVKTFLGVGLIGFSVRQTRGSLSDGKRASYSLPMG